MFHSSQLHVLGVTHKTFSDMLISLYLTYRQFVFIGLPEKPPPWSLFFPRTICPSEGSRSPLWILKERLAADPRLDLWPQSLKIFYRIEVTFNTEMHGTFNSSSSSSYFIELIFFLKYSIKFILITTNSRCQDAILKPLHPKPQVHWICFLGVITRDCFTIV